MSDPATCFVESCRPANIEAAALGFPPFTTGLRRETPLNSAPFLFSLRDFHQQFGISERRLAVLRGFRNAIDFLAENGVRWQALLAGGSFLRFDREPADLDGLLLYTIDPQRSAQALAGLRNFSNAMREERLDLRFCPTDSDPIILVKRSIFFSNLFSYDRGSGTLVHGTVMVIPDRGGFER